VSPSPIECACAEREGKQDLQRSVYAWTIWLMADVLSCGNAFIDLLEWGCGLRLGLGTGRWCEDVVLFTTHY